MEAMLKEQVAIVSGASSGMGKATALKFASEGADVVCVDINEEAVQETAAEIEKMGQKALACKCDITNSEMVKATVEACIETFGKVDILANFAGWGGKTDDPAKDCIERFTEDKFDALININLKGAWLFTYYVTPYMKKARSGKIVNCSSIGAIWPTASSAPDSAAKAGILGMTLDTARELAAYNVRVNAIIPGACQSNFFKTLLGEIPEEMEKGMYAAIASDIPLGKMGVPEDMANGALFLVSDLSSHITGEFLNITGGSPLAAASITVNN